MRSILKFTVIIFCILFFIAGCKRGANSGCLQIEMTDIPPDSVYEHVYIDLQRISINYDGAQSGTWMDLPTKQGVYDLLELQNDITVAITSKTWVPIGRINQIRFILGDNNTVVVRGVSHYMKVPSAYTSGIKILVNYTVGRNHNLIIVLDFDAQKSIHIKGNGDYSMEPVISVRRIID